MEKITLSTEAFDELDGLLDQIADFIGDLRLKPAQREAASKLFDKLTNRAWFYNSFELLEATEAPVDQILDM